ncbi:glycosyltransferase family 4 protein [bacterium]|nr:glycosyltransferase family 4 protein [bacterium]
MSLFLKEQAQLTLAVPELFWEGGRRTELQRKNYDSYEIKKFETFLPYKPYFYYLKGINDYISKEKPDIIVIYEEPVSFITFWISQFVKTNLKNTRIIGFSAENKERNYPFPFSWIYNRNIENTDHFICVNEGSKSILINRGVRDDDISIVPLGVNTLMFNKAEECKTEVLRQKIKCKEFKVIGWIGRMNNQKNPMEVVDAFKEDKDVFLVISGTGKLKSKVLDKLRNNYQGRFFHTDYIKPEDVSSVIKLCDFVVVSSKETTKIKEQFSRIVVETAACGKIPLYSSSGEMRCLFGDELCYGSGSKELRDMVTGIIKNKVRFDELTLKAYQISTEYSWKQAAFIEMEILKKFL